MINTGLGTPYILALAIDPTSPQTVYAGTEWSGIGARSARGGVYKSTNGGDSWSAVNTDTGNINMTDSAINALAIDPASPQTIYAGSSGAGVFRSTDAGASWSTVNTGLTMLSVLSLAIDPISPQTVYAGTWYGRVFKSTNGGGSWSAVNPGLTKSYIWALAIDPTSAQTIYASSALEGVFKSTSGGGSWSAANTGMTDTLTGPLAIDPASPQTIYAGTPFGVFKSTNGGGNWSAANTGMAMPVNTLAIDPISPQTIYAGTSGGVFKSTNGGGSWNAANTGMAETVTALAIDPISPQTIYAATYGGLLKSADGGASWRNTAPAGFIWTLAIDPTQPQTIYAGAWASGVFKSRDGGSTWFNTGLSSPDVLTLAIDPARPQTIYAGTAYGVFKSTNAGGRWTNTGLTASYTLSLAIDPSQPQTIYAGTDGEGVLKSTDGGGTWSAINAGLTNIVIHALAIDPARPQTIYAGTDGGGVFKSTDAGNSWSTANTSLGDPYILALAIDPTSPQTVYAGTYGGVFKSADAGGSWSAINTGLTSTYIRALALDPTSPQTIYAGSEGAGAWVYLPPCSSLSAGGATECRTSGASGATRVWYAKLTVKSGATPYGTAVFSFKQNGITVTEAGVPASPPTTSARVFIDYRSGVNAGPGRSDSGKPDVNTGIAVVNGGPATANVIYTLRDINGVTLALGHGTIVAGKHFAKFITELQDVAADFSLPPVFQSAILFGSLEIDSDQTLSVLGMRVTNNRRGEAIVTTTPTADLTQPLIYKPTYFAQLADGGGYTTSVTLLNTSGVIERGALLIWDNNGAPLVVTQVGGTPRSLFRYSIAAGGVFHFQTDGLPADFIKVGWVQMIPDPSSPAPVGSGLFSYNPGGTLVSESGIPAADSTNHARVYVDLSRNHNTGLAIANVNGTAASIAINAFKTDGVTGVGTSRGPLKLAGYGHDAKFADQFISGLPAGFRGVLDISSATPFAALTVRSLNNERKDFLMTTFPAADANQAAPSPIVFPQVADGGGYVTEFVLISAAYAADITLDYYDENGAPTDLDP